MKKLIFCFCAFSLLSGLNVQAQVQTIDKILSTLNSAEVFKRCIAFKSEISGKVLQLKSVQNIEPEKFNELRLAYTEVYEKYDAFLKTVKADLSNSDNLKNLVSNPETAAKNYAETYQSVKDAYENNFLQQLNSVQNPDSKGLPFAVLIKFGIGAFKIIVNSIKNHRIDKDGAINLILPAINEKLFNKLKLNTWGQFNLPEPGGYKTPEAIIIPERTLNTLHGTITFFQKNNTGEQDEPFYFTSTEGRKDLGVITENNGGEILATDEYFSTPKSYQIGSKFRLEVNNTGFSYILALNSNGIALLYPNKNVTVTTKGSTKDITISGEETPSTGTVNIPGYGLNGIPNYFTITKSATGVEGKAEEMAILLSKSELELEETIEKLNAVTGNLSERITRVFGEKKIASAEGNISMQENKVSFNADDSRNNVLPLVFKILKQ
jgi:hypothetical protein